MYENILKLASCRMVASFLPLRRRRSRWPMRTATGLNCATLLPGRAGLATMAPAGTSTTRFMRSTVPAIFAAKWLSNAKSRGRLARLHRQRPLLPSCDLHRRTGGWRPQSPNGTGTTLLFNTGTGTDRRNLRSAHRHRADPGSARLHHQENRLRRGAGGHAASAMERVSRSRHRREYGVASNSFSATLAIAAPASPPNIRLFSPMAQALTAKARSSTPLAKIFGDYATVADMGTFIATRAERHPTDLAKLCGARLVVAQETQRGRHWDETKIKALTGGDRMTARFMRQDFFDFVPTFKLFIAGNHKPRLSSVDEAMRDACCSCRLPSRSRPRSGTQSCREAGGGMAGDPALVHRRLPRWQRVGLAPPAMCGTQPTPISRTMTPCSNGSMTAPGRRVKPSLPACRAVLFLEAWCEERNFKPGSAMALSGMLADRGYEKRREWHRPAGLRPRRRQEAMNRDRAGDRSDRYSGYPRYACARETPIMEKPVGPVTR